MINFIILSFKFGAYKDSMLMERKHLVFGEHNKKRDAAVIEIVG